MEIIEMLGGAQEIEELRKSARSALSTLREAIDEILVDDAL
jgi:hypothetical protein